MEQLNTEDIKNLNLDTVEVRELKLKIKQLEWEKEELKHSFFGTLSEIAQYKNIEIELGIDLIALLSAKCVYIATFLYWRWNFRDKQQCKKDDIGAIEEKRIEEKRNFCIDLINKEIVIIESKLVDDFDYETRITKLKFKDYKTTWALEREELE